MNPNPNNPIHNNHENNPNPNLTLPGSMSEDELRRRGSTKWKLAYSQAALLKYAKVVTFFTVKLKFYCEPFYSFYS